MAVSPRLKQFLDDARVSYTVQQHPTVYTAQEIAAAQHVSGRRLAKCVVLSTEKGLFLAALPATHRVDFKKLKTLLKVKKVSLASEGEIKRLFPDIDVGAMSVFGNLYQVPTVMDTALADAEELVCNAGTHTDTVTLRYADVLRLGNAQVGSFGLEIAARKAKPKSRTRVSSKGKGRRAPSKGKKTTPRRGSAARASSKKRPTARRRQ